MDYLYALQCIRESSPDFINIFFVFFSEVVPKIFLVIASVMFWCLNKSEGAGTLLGYSTAYGINQTVKNIACVYRPWILDSRLQVAKQAVKSATGYSFPSGHTVTVASLGGGFALWRKKIIPAVLTILSIILVAFSRNWLGAHTMKDVLVAICIAAITIIIINLMKYYLAKNPQKDTIVMICGLLISGLIIVFLQLKSYPLDYDSDGEILCDPYLMLTDCYTALGLFTGGIIGWWLERHFVKFTTEASVKELIIRGIIGAATSGAIYYLIGLICKSIEAEFIYFRNPGHMIKSFMSLFYIFYLYPLIFNGIHKKISK